MQATKGGVREQVVRPPQHLARQALPLPAPAALVPPGLEILNLSHHMRMQSQLNDCLQRSAYLKVYEVQA